MIRRVLIWAVTGLLLLPAAAAAAPDTVVNFEGQAPGTVIDEQYTGVGVLFGVPQRFGLPREEYACFALATPNGIAGTSVGIDCRRDNAEVSPRGFGTAIEFATERRAVRFKLRQSGSDTPVNAEVKVYAIGARELERRTVALGRGAVVEVALSRPGPEIAAIVVTGATGRAIGPVLLDDVVAAQDDVPPPPKFALALGTPRVDVVEGASASAPVSVRRFNGSTGAVTLSFGPLPAEIRAARVEPNPLTGRNPGSIIVTANRPASGTQKLMVRGGGSPSAGTGVIGQVEQELNVVPAVQLAEGGREPLRLVQGCGAQTFRDGFSVRGGYGGEVAVQIREGTGPPRVATTPSAVPVAGDGFYGFDYALRPDPDRGGAAGDGTIEIGVMPSGGTPSTLLVRTVRDTVRVDSIDPAGIHNAVFGGERAAVLGNFPAGCTLTFQDALGQTWQQLSRDTTTLKGNQVDRVLLEVPRNAASGVLRALSPEGAELARSPRYEVTDFRNTHAMSAMNGGDGAGAGDFTWEEFERVFGKDDTEACFLVCVRDPIAAQYFRRFRDRIKSRGGLCMGWSTMALRFNGRHGAVSAPGAYFPAARRGYEIPAPQTDGTDIKRDVVRWQVAQNDDGYGRHLLAQKQLPAAQERQQILELISRNGAALLTIRQGDKGHAVVAYASQPRSDGGLILSIYDPNTPYDPSEETGPVRRRTQLTESRIVIGADGDWSGSSLGWAGANDTLAVIGTLAPENAELPSGLSVFSLFSAAGSAPPATVTSIRTGGTEALTPDGTGRAGSGVSVQPLLTGVEAQTDYQLQPGRDYAMTIRGNAAGRYEQGLVGRGAAATVRGASTGRGQEDRLTVRPGTAQLTFATAGAAAPVTYDLADQVGKVKRTAVVQTTAGKGVRDEVKLDDGALSLAHAGPATKVTLTLGSVGEGLPGTVTTVPIPVGRDQRLEVRPRRWSDLGSGAQLAVRNARGRLVRRAAVGLVPTKVVGLTGIAARRRGTVVTISGRVTKRGAAPVLAAVVERVRRGKVVGRHTVTQRGARVAVGRFSLRVRTGRVPRGTALRVRVTLLDEAAALARVQRTVTVPT